MYSMALGGQARGCLQHALDLTFSSGFLQVFVCQAAVDAPKPAVEGSSHQPKFVVDTLSRFSQVRRKLVQVAVPRFLPHERRLLPGIDVSTVRVAPLCPPEHAAPTRQQPGGLPESIGWHQGLAVRQ